MNKPQAIISDGVEGARGVNNQSVFFLKDIVYSVIIIPSVPLCTLVLADGWYYLVYLSASGWMDGWMCRMLIRVSDVHVR